MSRQTVRQTFGVLEQEGWLHRVQGKGTYVSEPGQTSESGGGYAGKTIGIMTTYISDYIFPHIVRGAEAELRRRGYRMLLCSTDNDKNKEKENLDMLLSEPISGLIIEPTKSAEGNPNLGRYLSLEYKRIPYVMINERYSELGCPYVKVDDRAGGYKAAEHLIKLGHSRLAGFFKTDDLQGTNRLKGFIDAHRELGVPLMPLSVIPFTTEERLRKPYESAIFMLKQPVESRPTAFVCYNDELALLLLEAIRQSGLTVPEQISIVGFDDSPLAVATETKLTTLSHPKAELGAKAAQLIVDMIERSGSDESDAGKGVCFEPELIVRTSTALLNEL
jgi:GntR family transcriptional regulator of arabinose operon